jgi:hypothetical protein
LLPQGRAQTHLPIGGAKQERKRRIEMTTTKNKTLRITLALIVAIALCLGSFTVATADESSPANATISKVLQMPTGTEVPALTFTFEIASKTADGAVATAANMPIIGTAVSGEAKGTVTIGFTSAEPGTKDTDATDDVDAYTKSLSSALFTSVTWPGAGIYTYEVTERSSVTQTLASGETVAFSGAKYEIVVGVKANSTGTGHYVNELAVNNKLDDAGGAASGKTSPPTGGTTTTMVFTNTYTKIKSADPGGTDNPTTDASLSISKAVSGDYASYTTYFPFQVSITKNSLVSGTPIYKAYVVDTTNAAVTDLTPNGGSGGYFSITAGAAATTINLKAGQRIAFVKLPVGTGYTVTETGTAGYTPSITGTAASIPAGQSPGVGTGLSTGAQLVTAGSDAVAFTNTHSGPGPLTGLDIENLPYYLLIILALAALAAFIAIRARRRSYQ